ncbi:MAG: putative glycoside hydrolase [Gemmatimonadaceae bacterium]
MVNNWVGTLQAWIHQHAALAAGSVLAVGAGTGMALRYNSATDGHRHGVAVPDSIRGVYLRASVVGTPVRADNVLRTLSKTRVNTVVIDVKDDGGVLYESALPLARQVGLHKNRMVLRSVFTTAHSYGLFVVARMVTFKDGALARRRPEWALRDEDGRPWIDRSGSRWIDPWNRDAHEYNLQIAEEVAQAGADAIQFDYVRFPEPFRDLAKQVSPMSRGSRDEGIGRFLADTRRRLGRLGVAVAADVFGYSMHTTGDLNIGQQWETVLAFADHVSPMVYPSHYSRPGRGSPHPNACPYAVTLRTLSLGMQRARRLQAAKKPSARIVPWLQAFDATWVDRTRYGPRAVAAQIRGALDAGVRDWILWNPRSDYSFVRPALTGDPLRMQPVDLPGCSTAFPRPASAPRASVVRQVARSSNPFDP